MSEERTDATWIQLVVSAVVGGAAVAAAGRFDVDKLIVANFQNGPNSTRNVSVEPIPSPEPAPQIILRLPLTEKPLEPEIIERISQNLVSVTRVTRPEYKNLDPTSVTCSGFITRSFFGNYPYVITAHHCVPSTVVSEADGKIYDSTDEEGDSIFDLHVTDITGNTYIAEPEFYYNDPLNRISNDVLTVRLKNESEITVPPLALNISQPNQWETYYIVRRSPDNQVSATPIRFLGPSDETRVFSGLLDEYRFISIGSADNACIPGVSGSVVVNSAGEVVSIITNISTHIINQWDVQELNLDPVHDGRVVNLCLGPSSRRIMNLGSE